MDATQLKKKISHCGKLVSHSESLINYRELHLLISMPSITRTALKIVIISKRLKKRKLGNVKD